MDDPKSHHMAQAVHITASEMIYYSRVKGMDEGTGRPGRTHLPGTTCPCAAGVSPPPLEDSLGGFCRGLNLFGGKSPLRVECPPGCVALQEERGVNCGEKEKE
jgi:hypothetical protein